MHRGGLWVIGVLGLALVAGPAWAEEVVGDTPQGTLYANAQKGLENTLIQLGGGLEIYDEQGVDIKAVKAPFTMHIGALVQLDYSGTLDVSPELEAASGGGWSSGWDFRRARIQIDGTVFKAVHYRVRYNFVNDSFQDLYLDWSRPYDEWDGFLPRIRLGQIREPLSLEALTGARWLTFMERASPVQAFAPLRNPGIRLQASPFQDHVTWWLGVFAPNVAKLTEFDIRSGVSLTGRFTWLLLAPRGDRSRLLSVGGGFNVRFAVDEERFAADSGTARGAPIVDTGTFAAHQTEIWQLELAFVHDRFSAQSEVFYAHSTPKKGEDVDYLGFYFQASWFLTPPGRNFNRPTAVFSRVKPPRPVVMGKERGIGAWEIAARYSYVDLAEPSLSGGVASQVTLGLNWYPTQWTRVSFNYIFNEVQDAYGEPDLDGTAHEIGIRFEVDI